MSVIKAASIESTRRLVQKLGIPRSTFYYHPKLPDKDWHLKNQIEQVLSQHNSYGHKRIAWELGVNKKRVRRVMKLFGIKPYRRRGRKYRKSKGKGQVYPNLLQAMPFPNKVNQIYVSDFTHISFHGKWLYLATVMDLFSREVVGWSLLSTHSTQLVLLALIDALEKRGRPRVLHSDQGSEYKSRLYTSFAEDAGIKLSMSHKGSPWENGFQESFYSQLKVDLGDTNRFKTTGELTAALYYHIHYYNTGRIHTAFKMPPQAFAQAATNQVLLTHSV
jgi:putative transposase